MMPSLFTPQQRVIIICFTALVCEGYDLIVYGSAAPALLAFREWSLTPQQIGAIGSYTLLGMFVGALSAGALMDRLGCRRLLIGLVAWFSLAMAVVAAAPSPELFGFGRFLAGLGLGGAVPTAIALTVRWAPEGRRNLHTALMLCGFPIGGVIAAGTAISILPDHGFRVLFAIGTTGLVTVVPLALWLLPETARQSTATPRTTSLGNFADPRSMTALALLSAANFCGVLLAYGLYTWLPELMRAAGYPIGPALAFLLALNLGAVAGGILGSSISDRIGGRWVTGTAFTIAALGVWAMGMDLPAVVLYMLIVVVGASTIGTQIILFGFVATHFEENMRPLALGTTMGLGRLGGAVGPLIGGYLVANHLSLFWDFSVFAAVAAAGALCAFLVPAIPASRTPPLCAGVAVT